MVEAFIAWGPWGLAAAAFLGGSVLPLPTEAVLVALIAVGKNALAMALIATLANALGAATLLLAGRSGREIALRYVQVRHLERAERHFRRFGPALLLLSWVPLVGDAVVLIAGILRTPWHVAFPLLVAGKAVRFGAVVAGALWFLPA